MTCVRSQNDLENEKWAWKFNAGSLRLTYHLPLDPLLTLLHTAALALGARENEG